MAFKGHAAIPLTCGANEPPTGSSTAVLELSPGNAPEIKIHSNGTFREAKTAHGVTIVVAGKFTGTGETMVFTIKTSGGSNGNCKSAKTTVHTS